MGTRHGPEGFVGRWLRPTSFLRGRVFRFCQREGLLLFEIFQHFHLLGLELESSEELIGHIDLGGVFVFLEPLRVPFGDELGDLGLLLRLGDLRFHVAEHVIDRARCSNTWR